MTQLPAVRSDLASQRVGDETVVLLHGDNSVLSLTGPVVEVFHACVDGLAQGPLERRLGAGVVESALADLEQAGVLAGTTRRAVLKRGAVLGGALAGTGLIATLSLPTAAAAASGTGGGGTGGGGGAVPGVVYTNAFDTSVQAPGGTVDSDGAGIISNGGPSYLGNLNHSTVTLSIPQASLAGTQYRLELKFYAIQSWDGDGPAGGNTSADPDALVISDNNGHTPLNASFANYGGGNTQSYPSSGSAPKTGNSGLGVLGYGTGDFGDTEYTFSFTLPLATTQDLVISIHDTLNQGLGDEEWGLRDLTVTTLA